jgi:serine/threonine-protein kinase
MSEEDTVAELTSTIGGRYALCGEIASGGMATVHIARQVGAAGFARIVAIKRLHERYARDPEFVAMFLDEARIVARIRHPNVVQTIDVVAEDGELFLVMEYVHGESLLRMMQAANKSNALLPIPVVAAVLAGALHGLHEAHEARSETGEPLGIVHRDVSPHNILVGVDGSARVLDFGVAKASERIQTTMEGQLKGKLSYMAPEQLTNRPMDRRTDVYAAAVVFWEALTGAKLFHGGSEGAVINQILLDPVRVPSNLNRAVPPALEAIVMRGLAREQGDRFASAREMALAIERATLLATLSEVGELVSTSCAPSVSARQRLIASIEARTSSSNLREAVDSLRSLASTRTEIARADTLRTAARTVSPMVQRVPSPSPLQTWPPPQGASGPPSPMQMPMPMQSSATSGAKDTGNARVIATIVASLVLVVSALAAGGYLFTVRRSAGEGPLASASTRKTVSASNTISSAPEGGPMLGGSATAGATSVTSATTTASGASSAVGATGASGASTCPEGMALVPGGRFFMGSDDDLPAERPAHKVELRAYCMDKLEVTTAAYRACSDRGDCKRAGVTNKWNDITAKDSRVYDPLCNGNPDVTTRGTHPINCVDWNMADRFCRAEGKRLPTEAEWEFAARGSDGRKYPWGDAAPSIKHLNACGAECTAWGKKHGAPLEALFTDSDGFATTAPVGSFPQGVSRWGIEDLVGNVWEWVADYHGPYTDADQRDPAGPATGATRVMRGGAWNGAYSDWVRPSFRFHDAADTRSHGVGFRCAKTL